MFLEFEIARHAGGRPGENDCVFPAYYCDFHLHSFSETLAFVEPDPSNLYVTIRLHNITCQESLFV